MCAKGVRVFFEGFGEESLIASNWALLVWKVKLWLGRREKSGETPDCFTSNTGFSGFRFLDHRWAVAIFWHSLSSSRFLASEVPSRWAGIMCG